MEPAAARDPLRIAVWAIVGFVAFLGSLAGLYASTPWPSKDSIAFVLSEVHRIETTMAKADEMSAVERRTNTLAIARLQQLAEGQADDLRELWAELHGLREYVYPQRSGRVLPPPRKSRASRGDD